MAYSFEADTHRLNAFYAALIRDCEYRIKQNRAAFLAEIARIKSPDAKAKYQGNYSDETCWQAYASDDFILRNRPVLRGLRTRFFGRGDKRGTEWFRLRRTETIHDISKRIDRAARLIRFISMIKLSWPGDAELKVFSAGVER